MDKILYVTNSPLYRCDMFLKSLETFKPCIESDNIWIIPGLIIDIDMRLKQMYGFNMFTLMLRHAFTVDYDYIIYFDEDCFLLDRGALEELFEEFKESGAVFGGVPDGGVCCHRSFNHICINPFLSFWNIKKLRNYINFDSFAALYGSAWESNATYSRLDEGTWSVIKNTADAHVEMYRSHVENDRLERLRKDYPTCDIAPGETYICDFEPYYRLQNWLLYVTRLPFFYFPARDINVPGVDEGISTEVVTSSGKVAAVHTWFARAMVYKNEAPEHVNRIYRVMNYFLSNEKTNT